MLLRLRIETNFLIFMSQIHFWSLLGPTRPWRSLTAYSISNRILDKYVKFWHNLDEVLKFTYQNLGFMSPIFWDFNKECVYNINDCDCESINVFNLYFKFKKYLFIYKSQILCEKKNYIFFAVFFRNTFKVQWFCKYWWLHQKNQIKFYQTAPVCIQKRFEVNKKRFFLVKKWNILVIVFMIMLTCSSKRNFNQMRYTGR